MTSDPQSPYSGATMFKRGWSRYAVGKYTALQVPAAALAGLVLWLTWRYGVLSAWLAWAVFLIWIAKDVALFFYLWPAYEPSSEEGPLSPVGLEGEVLGDMKAGYVRVRVRGETWRARPETGRASPRPGQRVRVVDRKGLLLIVREELTEERSESFV